MSRHSLTLSMMLHLGVLLISYFGITVFGPPSLLPTPMAISVELLPVSEISNVKPSKKRLTKKPPKKIKKIKKAKPKTVKDVKPKPVETPKEAVADPKKKPEVKPKEKPKKPEEKQSEKDFDAVLKSLEDSPDDEPEEKPEEKPKDDGENGAKSKSDNYNDAIPLSISEKDAIRGQFVKCWRMPAGAKNDYDLAVRVRVLLFPDGSVNQVGLAEDLAPRYRRDAFFRAAADSAIRAVWECNPIQNLPPEKYETWRDMELNFDPRELLY